MPPYPQHALIPWDDEKMETNARLARLEGLFEGFGETVKTKFDSLDEKVDRNREESKHDRANLKMALEQLAAKVSEQNTRLGELFSRFDQVKGAKKTLIGLGAVLTAFGLTGAYQVANFVVEFVKAHP